jgi:peptide/nickel transport system substrate-binding protein
MRTRIPIPISIGLATTFVAAALAGCSGSSGGSSSASSAAFNAATCQGGTLTVLDQGSLSEFDPARLYTSGGGMIPGLIFRALTTRDRTQGAAGNTVVPDLATDTGEPSANATVWTYHLKSGLEYQDGSAITSYDIKYDVERSFATELAGGPPYLRDWLIGGSTYQGPYKDTAGLASIATPDASTIVFHLRKPEGDFPYLAAETQFAPVPKAKDTVKQYADEPVSSGPYQIQSYTPKKSLVLVRNPHWSRGTDSQRLACPDKIDIQSGLDPAVINQRLAGGVGADRTAVTTDTNIGPTQLAQLTGNKALAARVVYGAFPDTTYLAFDTKKAPFDNLQVREAFAYAADREAVLNTVGGTSLATAATTFLPNQAALGYQPYDYFPAGASGDPAKAKQVLAAAGYPNGLTVQLSYDNSDAQGDGPAVATALQAAYAKAGITIKLSPIDDSSFKDVVTNPSTQPVLTLFQWGADWPSGAPFLTPIFDGREIVQGGGNFNLAQFNDAGVNAEIDQISQLTDNATAQKRWGALDAELGKQALTVPLYFSKSLSLYGPGVKNAYLSEWRGTYDLAVLSVK